MSNCQSNGWASFQSLVGEHGSRADDGEPAAAAALPVRVEGADGPVEREGDAAAREVIWVVSSVEHQNESVRSQ